MICLLKQLNHKERKTAMSKYITIGMDLGNKKHTVCALDQAGNVLWRRDVANTPEALKPFFDANAGATVAMETGLCCRWISALAKSCGCDVLVGNARKLAAICRPALIASPAGSGSSPFGIGCSAATAHPAANATAPSMIVFVFMFNP